jgi:hypothetical protein
MALNNVIREFTFAAFLLGVATPLVPAPSAFAGAPQVQSQAPGFYRVMLGRFEVTALLDGTHPFLDAAVLMAPKPGVPSERTKLFEDNSQQANALLAAADLKAPTEGSINAFLINTGTKLVSVHERELFEIIDRIVLFTAAKPGGFG